MKGPIRMARASDAAAVAEVWTEAYVTLGVGGRAEPYVDADFLQTLREAKILVWEEPDEIAGVIVLRAPQAAGLAVAAPGEAELSHLAVWARYRRRGIGRELVVHCGKRARREGWPAIALWSRPGQVEAHHLYEGLGYRRLPERDSIDDSGQARLVFRLEIRPRGTMPT